MTQTTGAPAEAAPAPASVTPRKKTRELQKPITMLDAINEGLDQALERDPSVILYGEDVGVLGGVFRVTSGLQAKHGKHRVFDCPLTESGIVGTAVGAAALGMRPIVELQFGGFMYPGYNQIQSHVGRFRYRTRGRWSSPMVIRFPYGGGLSLLEQHADSPEALLAHTPGIKIAMPSNAYDAKGLLLASIEDDDPVVFFECIKLYRGAEGKGEVPPEYYTVPLGKARVAREGSDVTIISWGAMVHTSLEAAKAAAEAGISVEVLDMRTVVPLDLEAILQSVHKTGRVVIVHEAQLTAGFGAEVSALIAEHALYHLEAPIVRVASFDTMASPFNAVNHFSRPEAVHVAEGIRKVMSA
jgi:pyruvate dehydrogenase E1 component beta subunit